MRTMLTSLGISLLVTAVAGTVGVWAVRNELAERPPIAIVDYGPLAAALNGGEKPAAVQPYLAEFKRRAVAYRKAGYVVINAASVDAAPDDVYIPPPDDLPKAWQAMPASETGDLVGVGSDRQKDAP